MARSVIWAMWLTKGSVSGTSSNGATAEWPDWTIWRERPSALSTPNRAPVLEFALREKLATPDPVAVPFVTWMNGWLAPANQAQLVDGVRVNVPALALASKDWADAAMSPMQPVVPGPMLS